MGLIQSLGRGAVSALQLVGGALFVAFTAIFGRVHWDLPPWLRRVGKALGALLAAALADKTRAATALTVLGALGYGGYRANDWWQHRPRPEIVSVALHVPTATRLEEPLRPDPLLIDFGKSVAPLKSIGKAVPAPVDMRPKAEGVWKWESDRQLSFTPRTDWPVGEDYKLGLPRRGLTSGGAQLSTYDLKFSTAPFSVSYSDVQFYQDPVDANLKKIVATVAFSHPVDTASFERRVHETLIAHPGTDEKDRAWKWSVSYDRLRGTAFLHSDAIAVPEKDTDFKVRIDGGVASSRGGPATKDPVERVVKVPGLYNYFSISALSMGIADNERYEPEQVLVIETSTGVADEQLGRNLSAVLLPLYDSAEEEQKKTPHAWRAEMVGQELVKRCPPVPLEAIASEKEYDTTHSFRFRAPAGRYAHVAIKKGVAAFGGYILGESWTGVAQVPEFPKALRILHRGALLSLSGEKKVSIVARDVEAVRFEVGRILPNQLQHLVTQQVANLGGSFQSRPWGFGVENMVETFSEQRTLPHMEPGKPQYPAFDLSSYLMSSAGAGSDKRGLFFFRVASWDPRSNTPTGASDSRLLLLTDLGLLIKDAADGTHEVFVQSIRTGDPVAGAQVEVLGKNGLPVAEAVTDGEGRAHIGSFDDLRNEKQASLFVVKKDGDLSFLPVGRNDRFLDLSRFDVGGVRDSKRPEGLTAFLFSDRGIYRPGDEARVGIIVKSRDFTQSLEGVPLEAVITDARGMAVRSHTIKLDRTGFVELAHQTQETSPTGTWAVNLFVVRDGQPKSLLGSTSFVVREFLPDRMKISAHLSSENPDGWVSPRDLAGRVTLRNLFGTPAEKRRVRGSIALTPVLPSFGRYRDYHFYDPMHAKEGVAETLADSTTDEAGEAAFDLHLERFVNATYKLSYTAQGFESEGGRSVFAETTAIVSSLPFLVGYKADGNLGYIARGAKRSVDLIAIDPKGDRTAAGNLRAILVERRYVSVLTRQQNGTYAYTSVQKEMRQGEKPLSIAATGTRWPLSSERPGDYALLVQDGKDLVLARIEWSVAGQGNLSRALDTNAELGLSLRHTDVKAGDEIEMQIKAPYVGAGLITIERDRVYAHKWFKADTTASVQTIRLPPNFEGNGYVSVAFIRDINSTEIFMSPLSYGVAPFSVSRAERTVHVEVTAPDLARPGDLFKMRYKTDRPSKIVVFAVDEGVLHVIDYKTPDPLGYFFQKKALEVRSAQILDLILPEFSRLMAAAPGGDDDGGLRANLNPFARKHDKPVAFWSGILDAGPTEKEIEYRVPESWNGTLRVMAVAVSPDALGAFEKKSLVRGDFVLSPNLPLFAAPGDEFEVSVGVANNVVGSGANPRVTVELSTSKQLEVLGPAKQEIVVGELRESSALFRVRATEVLGSGGASFTASLGGRSSHLTTDLSVRPPLPYLYTLQAGHLASGATDVKLQRALRPEERAQSASISYVPLALAHGLVGYLEKFPHGCTEQIVSQAMAPLVLRDRKEFGYTAETSQATVEKIINQLAERQNDEGAFGLWAGSPHVVPMASVYATHFLIEARERGYAVPAAMRKGALDWLSQFVRSDGEDLAGERVRAYAIYLLTRSGVVTSNFATALQRRLEATHPKEWKQDLAGLYLASTFKLLQQEKAAASIMNGAGMGAPIAADYANYYDGLTHDALYLYLLARHFPERLPSVTAANIRDLAAPVIAGTYNTFSSASTIMALDAYASAAANTASGQLSVEEIVGGGRTQSLSLPPGVLPQIAIAGAATAVRFKNGGPLDAFFVVSQGGFDRALPASAEKRKLEVYREYTDLRGKAISGSGVKLGDEILVHVRVRSLVQTEIENVAILDLLPGGFEVVVVQRAPAEGDHGGDSGSGANDGEGGPADEGREGTGGDEGGDEPGEGGGDHSGNGGGRNDATEATAFALSITQDGSTWIPSYGDVREDRVVLYGSALTDAKEYIYKIRATATGSFVVPPIQAEGMYDRTVLARALGGKIVVQK